MTKEIEKYAKRCQICSQFQRPKVEPLCPTELPDKPWLKVGTDLFMWKQATYLLVIDYYSRFIEIAKLSSTTSEGVITHLKSIIARHGIPQTVILDNGPQYASSSFNAFADQYGFQHITSSPRYPQGNGEAERAVQTIKGLLRKSSDPYLALLSYRSTPLKLGYSPAELLMSRRLRTTVPVSKDLQEPKLADKETVKNRDRDLKRAQKEYYDRRHCAKEQSSLFPGQEVWIPDNGITGRIQQEESHRSYSVTTQNEGAIRRNRRQLNPLPPQEDAQETQSDGPEVRTFSTSVERNGDQQVKYTRSGRKSKPPDRYGIWM